MLRRIALLVLLFSMPAWAAAEWVISPITLWGTVGSPINVDMKVFLENTDNAPVTFRTTGMPGYLTLSAGGVLTGTPAPANEGNLQFKLFVSDGTAEQPAIIDLRIETAVGPNPPQPPNPPIDPPNPPQPPITTLRCKDGSVAALVGQTPDSKYDLFACPR